MSHRGMGAARAASSQVEHDGFDIGPENHDETGKGTKDQNPISHLKKIENYPKNDLGGFAGRVKVGDR